MKAFFICVCEVIETLFKGFVEVVLFLLALSIVVFLVSIAFVPELREWFVEAIRIWSAS